jgi:DNA-binding transcriptional ArsR family regulator
VDTFQALAEPTRRSIIEMLAKSGQLSATDISDKFKVSPPAISQHLKVLREAKLIDMEKRAQRRIYTINTTSLLEVQEWAYKMQAKWEEKFSRLDKLLEKMKRGEAR